MSIAYQFIKLFEKLEKRSFSPFYEDFKKTEFSGLDELKALQLAKLKKLIRHAYHTVPYYTKLFKNIGFDPDDLNSPDQIKILPFLTKKLLKNNYDSLVSESYDKQQLIEYSTGGSTGIPTKFLLTQEQYDSRAAVSFKSYQMTGWDFLKKTVFLSGAPPESSKPNPFKEKLKSLLMRQLSIPAYDLNENKLHDLYTYIKRKKPKAVFGYISALQIFAQYLEARNLKISIPIIVQMAEMAYPDQIEYLQKILGGTFFKHYGARDAIAMGIECEKRCGLHVNMDTLLIEILKENIEATEEDGEIVITDLYSYGMPLIRYRIGDVGRWKKESCSCGRQSPLFEVTQGRTTNILTTRDGILTSGITINTPFRAISSKIQSYQVYQPDLDQVIIRIVKRAGFQEDDERFLEKKLRERLGNQIHIVFEYPNKISTEASGKYQFIKSDVPVSFGNN